MRCGAVSEKAKQARSVWVVPETGVSDGLCKR